MLNLSPEKKEELINEIIELSEKTNTDVILDLEANYKNINELLEGVTSYNEECDNINTLNEQAKKILNDTINFNNTLKNTLDSVKVPNSEEVL